MVYVFGIEGVPLFEMLFLIMLLMLAGLVFILIELRKLTSLLNEEKIDINRFENDLKQFETDEGKQVSQELASYVANARRQGMMDQQIEESLVKAGYTQQQVENIFAALKRN